MSALRAWVGRLPRPVIDSLRSARTAALWLLEPLDWLRRRVTFAPNRGPVPPLWLRRHAGPISSLERAADLDLSDDNRAPRGWREGPEWRQYTRRESGGCRSRCFWRQIP